MQPLVPWCAARAWSCPSQLTRALPPRMLGITQGGNRNSEPQPNILNQRESGTEIPNTVTISALGWVRPWALISGSHRISVKSLLCELKVAPLLLQSLNPGTARQTLEIPRSCLSYSCPWRSWAPYSADRATHSH